MRFSWCTRELVYNFRRLARESKWARRWAKIERAEPGRDDFVAWYESIPCYTNPKRIPEDLARIRAELRSRGIRVFRNKILPRPR